MFGPKRKIGKNTFKHIDPLITQKMYDKYVQRLDYLKKTSRPRASKEVMALAEGGDFSENAGYQAAKGHLRGINSNILELEDRIRKAKIITTPLSTDTIQLGHTVTLEVNGKEQVYTLLGSSESDPSKGIISHHSPIGSAIFGKSVGDSIRVITNSKTFNCSIIKISQKNTPDYQGVFPT